MASAKLGQGIEALLDGFVRFLPPAGRDTDAPLSGVVFALDHDPVMGKGAYVRLFGGQLRNREDAPLCGQEEAEKVTQIRRVSGPHFVDTGALAAGDIGVLYGCLRRARGTCWEKRRGAGAHRLAVPLCQVQAFPKGGGASAPYGALGELTEEDPSSIRPGTPKSGSCICISRENPTRDPRGNPAGAVWPGAAVLRAQRYL